MVQGQMRTWGKTRAGSLILGLFALVLAYVFASLAIDSGSLLEYALTLFCLAVSALCMVNFARSFRR